MELCSDIHFITVFISITIRVNIFKRISGTDENSTKNTLPVQYTLTIHGFTVGLGCNLC